jgi:hypothetical protein
LRNPRKPGIGSSIVQSTAPPLRTIAPPRTSVTIA